MKKFLRYFTMLISLIGFIFIVFPILIILDVIRFILLNIGYCVYVIYRFTFKKSIETWKEFVLETSKDESLFLFILDVMF